MDNMDRVILHCDMNGFFASVELLDHPELKNVPMAVCGSPDNRHGIILAKNELAKKAGVSCREISKSASIGAVPAGKIAKALGVPVEEIVNVRI